MSASLMPTGKQHYDDNNGIPLSGGKVYTYAAGTNTPKVTYSDAAGVTPNTNPVILDSRGDALIFWNGSYKVVLKDSLDNTIWTVDNVPGSLSSDLISFSQSGTGALVQAVQDELRKTLFLSDFDTLTNALSAAANNTLIVNTTVNITSNTTIPSNVSVVVRKPGLFNISSNTTLTIAGPFEAGNFQVFTRSGTGKVRLNAGRTLNALWYTTGGVGSAVNPWVGWEWMINDLNASDVSTVFDFPGDTTTESGVYKATTTLYMQTSCTMQGRGKGYFVSPKILGSHNGAATVSCKGASYCTIRDIIISGDVANPPKTGLCLGRNAGAASASGHYIYNMGVRGYWSQAAIYHIAAEDVTYEAIDAQLFGGGGKYCFYSSQDDDLSVDSMGGSTNSHVNVRNFTFANEVDDAAAASIYLMGQASTANWLFDGGWIGAYRGRYVQINSGGTTIGNLVGPVVFSNISGESGNATATAPAIGFDLTVTAGQGETDFNNLIIKNINLEIHAGGSIIQCAQGATDFGKVVYGEFESTQDFIMSLGAGRQSKFKTVGNITFAKDVYGCDFFGIQSTISKTVSISGASGGNRIYDSVAGVLNHGTSRVSNSSTTYTIPDYTNHLITSASGTTTLTLPAARAGKELWVTSNSAQAVNSASSNIGALATGALGTAILTATAGKWAKLIGDGTNWQIVAAN